MNPTTMQFAKTLLTRSVAALFAGLTFRPKGSSFKPQVREDNGCYGRPKKFYRNLVPDRPTFDFVSRASRAGYGIFRNRTTGLCQMMRITNRESTKMAPCREMPASEKLYFGLA